MRALTTEVCGTLPTSLVSESTRLGLKILCCIYQRIQLLRETFTEISWSARRSFTLSMVSDLPTNQRLDEDLLVASQAQHNMRRAFLLDVVIRQRPSMLQQLSCEDQTLLAGGNNGLVLGLCASQLVPLETLVTFSPEHHLNSGAPRKRYAHVAPLRFQGVVSVLCTLGIPCCCCYGDLPFIRTHGVHLQLLEALRPWRDLPNDSVVFDVTLWYGSRLR